MAIELARMIAGALDVRSENKIRTIDAALTAYVRLTPQSPVTPISGSFDASQVTTGEFDDARISESSVAQHEAALDIDWTQLTSVPSTFPPEAHNHAASDVNSGTFADARIAESNVTQHEAALDIDWTQLDNVPATFPPEAHTHDTDDLTDYAAGVWTPVDASGAGLTLSTAEGGYVVIGAMVFAYALVVYPATADTAAAVIDGLPFNCASNRGRQGFVSYQNAGAHFYPLPVNGDNIVIFWNTSGGNVQNATLSGATVFFTCIYPR